VASFTTSEKDNASLMSRPRNEATEVDYFPETERYDFAALIGSSPELAAWIVPHPDEGQTIDYNNPTAVLALNRALLKFHYKVDWDLPSGRLCPAIPSRADYIDRIARLLGEECPDTNAPRGERIRILDIGVGANAVYPLIGHTRFGWRFVGTDIDGESCTWARGLGRRNSIADSAIEIREQTRVGSVLEGVIEPTDRFAASVCNPPFFESKFRADAAKRPRSRALREQSQVGGKRAFTGSDRELWCEGGETGFLVRLISDSSRHPELCVWFTSLVSRRGSLPVLQRALSKLDVTEVRTLAQQRGNKPSRILAWTFLSAEQRRERLANP
jgi:23S rRNA (adenine1618-N6)-methyltransferase